ncbi:MAG TPA: hypothetical protein VIY90_15865 [Steroidobacteraceae bacterium]
MEPLILSEGSCHRVELTDLTLELAQRSAGLRRSLPPSLLSSLATLVRAPREDYSREAKKRDLQIEAKAHIVVQQWIDEGGLQGRTVTGDSIREIHRRFCELLPADLLPMPQFRPWRIAWGIFDFSEITP